MSSAILSAALRSELGKHIIAGSLALACDLSVLYLCTEILQIHYLTSTLLGYLAGLAVAYWLDITWVFTFRKHEQRRVELTIFNDIVVVGLLLNQGLMYLLVELVLIDYLQAKLVIAAVVMSVNYLAKKLLLFRRTPCTHENNGTNMDEISQ
jgi:putative flippase GtrA